MAALDDEPIAFSGTEREWHLIRQPRAPFRCDECGKSIPIERADTFTTLEPMYFETPPTGCRPCNRGFDPVRAAYDNIEH